jgi:hypothetical protein
MEAVKKVEIGALPKNKAVAMIMTEASKMDLDEDALFKFADKNGDGVLDVKEIGKCFEALKLA